MYSDNSKENIKAFKDLGYLADHCRAHRSETNGIAERAVRRVTEGTRAVLVQSGLHESEWWPQAMHCYCFLRCVVDKMVSDNKTPHERRFGVLCAGPAYPFGCEVEYLPTSKHDKDLSLIHI